MVFLELVYVFFKIGLLGFGGGYAMISLIQFEVVDHFGWMSVTEFSDMIAISQMTPGPVSINTATYVGYVVAGIPGAAVATFSLCLPSILLMILVVKFFFNNKDNKYVQAVMSGLRPILGGLILAAALLLMNRENFCDFSWNFSEGNNLSVLIFIVSFVALHFFKVNPMWIIVVAGGVGFFFL
jgi:chromate transporter